jgi:hypothetical protein
MKALKIAVLAALVSAVCSIPAFAQGKLISLPAPGFDDEVNFDTTVKDLDLAAREGIAPEGGYYVLMGSVGSIIYTSGEDEPFSAIVELVTGEWEGTSNVQKYHVYLRVSGPEFEAEFKKSNKRGIKVGMSLIVVVRFAELAKALQGGSTAAFFDTYKVRVVI